MNSPLPPGVPLSSDHARLLDSLLATLTADEALWLSGYLAGFARQAPVAEAAAEPPAGAELLILYASETGHSEALAEQAEERAQVAGLAVRRVDLADFKPPALREARRLLLLTSTHGDGDPPVPALDFSEFLLSRKAPRLENLEFAVLGLGDSSYANFCQAAKMFDQRLVELGATRIHPRLDCDVDFEAPAADWIGAVLEIFGRSTAGKKADFSPSTATFIKSGAQTAGFDQKHPYPASLIERLTLNGRGSAKQTLHLELALAGSGLSWEPGDSLGVLPDNPPELVAELIAALQLKAAEPVAVGTSELPLAEALTRHYEITQLTPGFIQRYAEAAEARLLGELAAPHRETELRHYMAGRQIIDVVAAFPPRGLSGPDFVAMLRPQQPRLYSLASSAAAEPDDAHLTVAVVRYASHGRPRGGIASTYLAERRAIDQTVPVYVSPNRNFRLPADPATAVIMIGAGTGVAPFRAFLQERAAGAAPGRNWLFFGDRHFRTDFLYQTEWQRLIKDGRLTRMDVAFSRDQADKVYVQHRLLEHGREIHAWLEEGACLYVCGDASRLAPDVHAALADILAHEGGVTLERAEEQLRQLQRDKRYQRDVY